MGLKKVSILFLFLAIIPLSVASCNGAETEPTKSTPPSPPPIYTQEPCTDQCGTVRFYVAATKSLEGVTSLVVTISDIRLLRYLEGQWSTEHREDTGIMNNTYTFDLLQIGDTGLLLGSSQQYDGYYTRVNFSVDKAEVTMSDGRRLEAELPTLPNNIVVVEDGEWRHISTYETIRDFNARGLFRIITGETTDLVINFDTDKSLYFANDESVIFKPVTELGIRPESFIYEVPQDNS